jgi:hypothetical protein
LEINRQRIWRDVAHVEKGMEDAPREGHRVVVEARLRGRSDPIEVVLVETRRDPDYPWIKFFLGDDNGGYVFVHEGLIERIEVSYKRDSASPTGFSAVETD